VELTGLDLGIIATYMVAVTLIGVLLTASRREASPNGDVLSPACPPGVIPRINLNNIKELMVEAAGIEPDPGQSTNRLMAHDFFRKTTISSRFSPSIESPGVPWSRPQSWRYFGDGLGVLPVS
jgi:hypothetical protein